MKTGEWVRRAASGGGIVVMDRGRAVAKIGPLMEGDEGLRFTERRFVDGFEELPRLDHDSTEVISDDRDRG